LTSIGVDRSRQLAMIRTAAEVAAVVYPTVDRHSTPLRTASLSPQIPAKNVHHCRALAGKTCRGAPRRTCFIAKAPQVNAPTTGRWGSSHPGHRGSARAY